MSVGLAPAPAWVDRNPIGLAFLAALMAALVAVVAAVLGPVVPLVLVLLAVAGVCAVRPHWALYIYLALLPFVAGFPRGAIPLRPNEMILALVLSGAITGLLVRYASGQRLRFRLVPALDVPLAIFVLLATVWPLTSVMLRGAEPSFGEVIAIGPALKLTVLLTLVRATVTTVERMIVVLRLVIWTAAGIAAIAVAQTLRIGPVLDLLARVDPTLSGAELTDRGTTTLASSIATGDYVVLGLIVLAASTLHRAIPSRELLTAGFVLASGALAAGQFSTWIIAAVAGGLILWRAPELRERVLRLLPLVGLAFVVGAPALINRLSAFGEDHAVPRSWLGRWDNLDTFYFDPLIFQGGFIMGVSPNSVLPAPETWRESIFLESGYLDLLWIGGIPLLAAFCWLSIAVLRESARVARRTDLWATMGFSLGIAWATILVISIIDPHLFLRGTGDLLFILLGAVGVALGQGDP